MVNVLETDQGDDSLREVDAVTGLTHNDPLLKIAIILALAEIGLPGAAPALPVLTTLWNRLPKTKRLVAAYVKLGARTADLEEVTASFLKCSQDLRFEDRQTFHPTTTHLARAMLMSMIEPDVYDEWDDDNQRQTSPREGYPTARVAFIAQAQRDPKIVSLLLELTDDTDPNVRGRARRMLEDLAPNNASRTPVATRMLISSWWRDRGEQRFPNIWEGEMVFRGTDGSVRFIPSFSWRDHVLLHERHEADWCVVQRDKGVDAIVFILPKRERFETFDPEFELGQISLYNPVISEYVDIVVPQFSLRLRGEHEGSISARRFFSAFNIDEHRRYSIGGFPRFSLCRPFFFAILKPGGRIRHLGCVEDPTAAA